MLRDDHPYNGRIQAPRLRRALVTGCAGFLGSHLSERLLDLGWDVAGVDCFTDYYPRARKQRNLDPLLPSRSFTMRELDLSTDNLEGLLDGVDVVFHLAAQPGVRGSFGATFGIYARNNILATQRLLEAAVESGVETVVYASSSSIYGDAATTPTSEDTVPAPLSPYGMTKVATEAVAGVYARTAGLRTVGLRYFTAYGPRQRPDMAFSRFIGNALAGKPLTVLGDGTQIRDFTYVQDVIEATGAHVFNVGGSSPVPLTQVFDLLEGILERPLLLEHRQRQMGDARHTSADVSRAAEVLGFQPRTSLEEGLRAQVAWLQYQEFALESAQLSASA